MIRSIAHATDFSPEGAAAFAHALRLAVAFRSRLDLLHVRSPTDDDAWGAFPHVRETLARWGMLPAGADHTEIEARLGVTVRKIEVHHHDAIGGIVLFLLTHRPELLVVATHGRSGLNRWLSGSVSEGVARDTHIPTLFLGPQAQAFVDANTGSLRLTNIALPIAAQPSPIRALNTLGTLLEPLDPRLHLFHVGDAMPEMFDPSGVAQPVDLLQGPVVETIVEAAVAREADMIAMPTAGHHGFLDALRGSTTERVLHQARRPLLALPA